MTFWFKRRIMSLLANIQIPFPQSTKLSDFFGGIIACTGGGAAAWRQGSIGSRVEAEAGLPGKIGLQQLLHSASLLQHIRPSPDTICHCPWRYPQVNTCFKNGQTDQPGSSGPGKANAFKCLSPWGQHFKGVWRLGEAWHEYGVQRKSWVFLQVWP